MLLILFGIVTLFVLIPTQMASGPLADWMGYRAYFVFVVVATIPSLVAAKLAPFPRGDGPDPDPDPNPGPRPDPKDPP